MKNRSLFLEILKINAVTFGGGFTIAPVIKEAFVTKHHVISEEEMLNIIAIAQSGPGALAVSTSFLVGYRINGLAGGLTALLAAVLPPLVIISVLFFAYASFSTNIYVKAALRGMSGIIGAILVMTCYQLSGSAYKKDKIAAMIFILYATVASLVFHVNTSMIIISMAVFSATYYGFIKKGGGSL